MQNKIYMFYTYFNTSRNINMSMDEQGKEKSKGKLYVS